MNDWNQTRANVAATFAARFLIHWLKIITYCAFILTDALLICIFSDNFAVIICCERKRRGAYSRRKTRDNWWCKNSVISYYTAILYWGPLPPTLTVFMNAFLENNSGPSISLRASSAGRSGGGAGKGSRASATTSLEYEFRLQFSCGFPSTELSDFRQSVWSGGEYFTLRNSLEVNDIS